MTTVFVAGSPAVFSYATPFAIFPLSALPIPERTGGQWCMCDCVLGESSWDHQHDIGGGRILCCRCGV